jgi:hypothetical protein
MNPITPDLTSSLTSVPLLRILFVPDELQVVW